MVTKLVCNAQMTFAIPLVSLVHAQRTGADPERKASNGSILKHLAALVLGFIALSLLRTLGDTMLSHCGRALGL